MQINDSKENYLEAIGTLTAQNGIVFSIDIANYLGYSKPSVSIAIRELKQMNLVTMDANNAIHLTEAGKIISEQICERRHFFSSLLEQAGIDPCIADHDAHRLMHAISNEGFQKLKQFLFTEILIS